MFSQRLHFIVLLPLVFLSFILSETLYAQTTFDGMSIQAQSGERDLKNRSLELKGNVQIIFKGQHLKCDHAIIYQETKTFVAEGNVLFVTPKMNLGGRKIEMNYETNQGTIYSGFVQSGQMVLEGDVIEKTGEDQFLAYQSQFTSCTTCPPAWSFKGQTVEAEMGGYALIKNSFFRIGTVPILWLPYLIIPLKSDRQTGLLTPTLKFKKEGLSQPSLSIPFFWAISKSQDATITVQDYSDRGLKSLVNYRYFIDKNSYGEMDSAYMSDRVYGQSDRHTNYFKEKSKINRWFLNYKHYWTLPNDWIQRTQINSASDLNYYNDFPSETPNIKGEPATETSVSLTKNTYDYHFSIDNSYYTSLLRGNPNGGNQDSVHRLPEISFSTSRRPIGDSGFFYNYDIKYAYFARNDFAYDDITNKTNPLTGETNRQVTHECNSTNNSLNWDFDSSCKPTRDGEFNAGTDLIRSGQRFILEPTITRPIQLGKFFNLIPKFSYRESHYNFGIENVSNLSRRYLRSEFKLQTSFSRIFGDLNAVNSERIKHEIEPEIIATSVPWIQQPSNHPFLGFNNSTEIPFYSRETLSDSDLDGDFGAQFDYNDRLFDRNIITYRITNKLTKKSVNSKNIATYTRFLTWRLSQTYDVYESRQPGDRQPWSDLESTLSIRLSHFNTYTKINFYPYQKLSDTSSHITFNNDMGDYIRFGLTRKYNTENKGFDIDKRTEDYLLQIGTTMRYINFAGRVIYNGNDITAKEDKTRIKDITYAVIFKPPGNCWGINFKFHKEKGTPDIDSEITFDFLYDGKSGLQSPAKLLSQYNF